MNAPLPLERGDRVMFLRNDREMGLKKRDLESAWYPDRQGRVPVSGTVLSIVVEKVAVPACNA